MPLQSGLKTEHPSTPSEKHLGVNRKEDATQVHPDSRNTGDQNSSQISWPPEGSAQNGKGADNGYPRGGMNENLMRILGELKRSKCVWDAGRKDDYKWGLENLDAKSTGIMRMTEALATGLTSAASINAIIDNERELFAQIYTEIKRLKGIEWDFEILKDRIARVPLADQQLLGGDVIKPVFDAYGNLRKPGEPIDIVHHDAIKVKESFQRRWRYCSTEDWGPLNLHGWREGLDVATGEFKAEIYGSDERLPAGSMPFSDCISPQLLLYRLTIAFGMPPANDEFDNHKQCWATRLERIGNKEDRLEFYDRKGVADVTYGGGAKGKKAALKLMSWLVGNNISNPYIYSLAGNPV
ncbi:hypothetical protein MGN70_001783 [Eutypa lata]|nr:hypothetical protein MGN70_001783 [Eutypa lata]